MRILSEAYPIEIGLEVEDGRLAERLERRGYRRVHARPGAPGEYFWGFDVF